MLYLITWTNWLYPLTFALLTLRRWWRRLVVKRRPAFIASNERQSDEADLRMGNGLRIFLNSTRLEYPYRPHSTTSAFRFRLRLRILEPLAVAALTQRTLSPPNPLLVPIRSSLCSRLRDSYSYSYKYVRVRTRGLFWTRSSHSVHTLCSNAFWIRSKKIFLLQLALYWFMIV